MRVMAMAKWYTLSSLMLLQAWADDESAAMLQKLAVSVPDTDLDGRVSLEEALEYVKKQFAKVDVDGDGFVKVGELDDAFGGSSRTRRKDVAGRTLQMTSAVGQSALGVAASVTAQRHKLNIAWQDGEASDLSPMWLRERCLSELSVDLPTNQPKLSPHEIAEVSINEVEWSADSDAVNVTFDDGHRSQFSLEKLRREISHFRESPIQVLEYHKLSPRLWRGSEERVPIFDFDVVSRSESKRLALIEEVLTGGQALVRGVPQEEDAVINFSKTLSTLRDTDWGLVFNVRTEPDDGEKLGQGAKFDLAYTPKPIGFHTDNPYRFPTPSFQVLHAVEHCSCPDGVAPCEACQVMNYMVDGFYIAELLRKEDPEAFALLCEVPVRFENNGGDNGSAIVHVAPHIELEDPIGEERALIRAIRFSAKSGQYAPPLSTEKLAAFYQARRRFSELAHESANIMQLQFRPGDLLVFDNERLLHARSAIAPTDGKRWLQGAYIDRDGLWLNYERWRRRNA